MNFVKTYIYNQIYTDEGILELEKDARSTEELNKNKILKCLPEFKRDNELLSLSEQIKSKKNNDIPLEENIDVNLHGYPHLNEENLDYYDHFSNNNNYSAEQIIKREKELKNEFNEAIKNCVKKKIEKEEKLDILKESINFREIKKSINKKKLNGFNSNIKVIFKTTKKRKSGANSDTKNVDFKESEKYKKNEVKRHSLLFGYSDKSDN